MINKTPYPCSIPRNQASSRKLQTAINIPEESSEPQLYSIKGIDSQRHKRPLQTAINIPDEYAGVMPSANSVNIIIPEGAIQELPPMDNYRSNLYRHAHTFKNIACRNMASVAMPVAVREYIRRALLEKIPTGTAYSAVGSLAGYLPCLLQFGGLYRDINNHTYTRWTIIGRFACIILPGAGVSVLLSLGLMTPAVSAAFSAANFVYTPFRDIIQNYVRCDNNLTPKEHERIIAGTIGSFAYALNQFAANGLMQYGADSLSQTFLGEIGGNVVSRAGVNFFGECLDDVTSLASTSFLTGQKVDTTLNFSRSSKHSWTQVADRIFNIHASRSSLLSSVFSAGTIAGKNDDRSSPVSTSIPTMSRNQDSVSQPYITGFLNESAAVGIASGLGYLPFILTGDQRNDPRRYDLEAGLNHSELP